LQALLAGGLSVNKKDSLLGGVSQLRLRSATLKVGGDSTASFSLSDKMDIRDIAALGYYRENIRFCDRHPSKKDIVKAVKLFYTVSLPSGFSSNLRHRGGDVAKTKNRKSVGFLHVSTVDQDFE